jgi:hypothetical protein
MGLAHSNNKNYNLLLITRAYINGAFPVCQPVRLLGVVAIVRSHFLDEETEIKVKLFAEIS